MDSILRQNGIDPEKNYLGKLCPKGHDWHGTGKSLRWRAGRGCTECCKKACKESRKRVDHSFRPDLLEAAGLSTNAFYLGDLCIRQHDWMQTGKTLRYKTNQGCPECWGRQNIGALSKTPEQRFWEKVLIGAPNECWEWQGSMDERGYGHLSLEKATVRAHRFSFQLHNGKIPDGLLICHKCDNPKCVNPEHLFLGTSKDNSDDKIKKGRMPVGTQRKGTVLDEERVAQVKRLLEDGLTINEVARRFKVSWPTIKKIETGERWKHVS